eukprot:Nk52_evm5s222 gene=Nk52_evmTU5s222
MKRATGTFWKFVLVLFSWCSLTKGLLVTVPANEYICLHENLAQDERLGLTFSVSEGGFLDIDFDVFDPSNTLIYSLSRESEGTYAFMAQEKGKHTYCFGNEMSTVTDKVVLFHTRKSNEEGEHQEAPSAAIDEKHSEVEDMIRQLRTRIHDVKMQQDYIIVREKVHRLTNDSTHSRVVWWSFFECVVLISMTLGQIYYLKKFFETKRVV